MLSVTAILNLYAWLYTSLPIPAGTFDSTSDIDGGLNAIKIEPDGTVGVYVHGSEDMRDWARDFQHFALPFAHSELGLIHPGFLAGALAIKPWIDAFAGDRPVNYYGHSYGAGRVSILAGLRITEGKPVSRVEQFGEPRAGSQRLSDLLKSVPGASHRNRKPNGARYEHDLVTEVPRFLGSDVPYQPLRPFYTDCEAWPRVNDFWGPFSWHHAGLYARAYGCGSSQALSLAT